MADVATRQNGRGLADFFGFDPFRALSGSTYGFQAEIQRTADGWTLELPVPGFRPDQIDVTAEDRVLTVAGKSERRSFQRSFVIPEEIDADAIDAKVENGLLALSLRLHPKAQPRKIEVKVGGASSSAN